jgi:hypothetical protein
VFSLEKWRKLVMMKSSLGIFIAIVVMLLITGVVAYVWKENVRHPEAGARGGLRALQAMELNFRDSHSAKVFARSWIELGIPYGARIDGNGALTSFPDESYIYVLSVTENRQFFSIKACPPLGRGLAIDETGSINEVDATVCGLIIHPSVP